MVLNWPHLAVTMAVILVVLGFLKKTNVLEGAGRGKRIAITFAALFVPIFILNLIWPYAGG